MAGNGASAAYAWQTALFESQVADSAVQLGGLFKMMHELEARLAAGFVF
jgi:hypothetical protein